jgi:histone-lysine N-methyltransferase SETMAR
MGFEVLDHPAYSPDLAPSDFKLTGPLKDALKGHHSNSDEEVKEAVHDWLAAQSKTFFSAAIQKFVEHWNKCIEKHEDYVEK